MFAVAAVPIGVRPVAGAQPLLTTATIAAGLAGVARIFRNRSRTKLTSPSMYVNPLAVRQQDQKQAAATAIQARFRGRTVRRVRQQEQKQAAAVLRLQARFRGWAVRQQQAEQAAAVLRLQACARGRAVRRNAAQDRQQQEQAAAAALRIQAQLRGRAARREAAQVQQQRDQAAAAAAAANAARLIQARFRGMVGRQQAARVDAPNDPPADPPAVVASPVVPTASPVVVSPPASSGGDSDAVLPKNTAQVAAEAALRAAGLVNGRVDGVLRNLV